MWGLVEGHEHRKEVYKDDANPYSVEEDCRESLDDMDLQTAAAAVVAVEQQMPHMEMER